MREVLAHYVPSLVVLWGLVIEDELHRCAWQDVIDGATNQVISRGGDLIIVSLVSP